MLKVVSVVRIFKIRVYLNLRYSHGTRTLLFHTILLLMEARSYSEDSLALNSITARYKVLFLL